jgi:hypothetical protein
MEPNGNNIENGIDDTPIIPDDIVIKNIDNIAKPLIVSIGEYSTIEIKNKTNIPSFEYALVELEIQDYDNNIPPIIKLFDEETNTLIETIEFDANTQYYENPINLKVPIFLSYDNTPWSNPNQEPNSKVTRIELHLDVIDHIDTAYASLAEGVYVVPVYWHNIAESQNNGAVYVDTLDIYEIFFTPPNGNNWESINTIWGQAKIQFRLMNTGIPFKIKSIPTHILYSPEKSYINHWDLGWKGQFSSNEGVDIFAVYDIDSYNDTNVIGIGNTFSKGWIAIKAGNPNHYNAGFTDKQRNSYAQAQLVAHEFGHYLGSLPHVSDFNNLMTSDAGGYELNEGQIELVRQRLNVRIVQNSGYNEKL